MNRKHAPFMLLVFASLLTGMWAGLLRVGWQLPHLHDNFALAHGVLMIGGFMGTLISLERAVAIHEFLKSSATRYLPYLAPFFSAIGAGALILDLSLATIFMTLSSLGMVLMFMFIIYKQTAVYSITMGLGALSWLIGNLIWLRGEPLFMSAPWWMAFLILTIAGERLELSRLMRHARSSIYLFAGAVWILLGGLWLTRVDYDLGVRLTGLGNVAIAVWLLRYDVVQRTIRQTGLTRFIAVCLGMGYGWLVLSGLMSVGYGGVKAGMLYDAILHTVFLGFAFSMIFGHAPIILPSVMQVSIRYSPSFYLHLMLLHLSLILRVGGDLIHWQAGRRWGALLNALVLLLFIANMLRALQTSEEKPLLPRSQQAYATYVLAMPLLVLGLLLVGVGFVAGIQADSEEALPNESTTAIARGERLYQTTCAGCHGINLQGIPGVGKNLVNSDFVSHQTDTELHTFIVQGRPSWDAANTTGIAMPARGGNPALSDTDIDYIIVFIRQETKH